MYPCDPNGHVDCKLSKDKPLRGDTYLSKTPPNAEKKTVSRIVCFDVDGTLLDDTVFIWETLHTSLKTDNAARAQARDDYFAGRITYNDWFQHDLRLFREVGITRERVLEVIRRDITPMGGAYETLATLQERGYGLAIISGSIDIVLHEFFGDIPFRHVLISRIQWSDNGKLIGGEATKYDFDGKARGLLHIAKEEGLRAEDCGFVGDNFNDLEAIQTAGTGIAFNAKNDAIKEAAKVVIPGGDLRKILPYFPPLNS